jgi:hypothetical protein
MRHRIRPGIGISQNPIQHPFIPLRIHPIPRTLPLRPTFPRFITDVMQVSDFLILVETPMPVTKRLDRVVDPGDVYPFALESVLKQILIGEHPCGDEGFVGGISEGTVEERGDRVGGVEDNETGVKERRGARRRRWWWGSYGGGMGLVCERAVLAGPSWY